MVNEKTPFDYKHEQFRRNILFSVRCDYIVYTQIRVI